MNIEKVIRNIVKGLLPLINKRVLIFVSGGTVNREALLRILSDSELINYDIVITDSAKKMIEEETIKKLKGNFIDSIDALDKAIRNCSFILIPVMTRNTISKAALGIADNLVTTGIARSIMMSKEIIAVRDSYHPENPNNVADGLSSNPLYNRMLLNYEKTLRDFGVKIIDAQEFRGSLQNQLDKLLAQPLEKRKPDHINRRVLQSSILTLTDIKRVENDDVIVIQKGTIITPLAKDYIYNNKINIAYSE